MIFSIVRIVKTPLLFDLSCFTIFVIGLSFAATWQPQGANMNYQIKVKGKLDESWSDWFGNARIESDLEEDNTVVTTFTLTVIDQPALFGILDRFRDMNLLPISIVLVDKEKLEDYFKKVEGVIRYGKEQ
jgi:hypothetical protein